MQMRKGDIILIRDIYKEFREYSIGEVISDVEWMDAYFFEVCCLLFTLSNSITSLNCNVVFEQSEARIPIRRVHWHYTKCPYNDLTMSDNKAVPYLMGQRTIHR
jgi:hypothetical protein